jgi:O-acetyl-ADP-ribose deacetylase (regulator of RNase III)
MIRYIQGDLFASKAQTLVNPVNCRGNMGKGLAKAFRERWPSMFRDYRQACQAGKIRPGVPLLFREDKLQILNFPTKDDWKEPSTYDMVEAGLQAIRENNGLWGITSLAIPALGCGLGGLEWPRVRQLMVTHLTGLPIEIEIYEPTTESGSSPLKL